MRSPILIVIALTFVAPLTAQDRRPMTTDDALDMVQVGSPLMSPDGDWVLFSKSELDWDENERTTTWWRVPADGSAEPYRFIGEEGGSSFQFSPDGAYLSFLRRPDGGGNGSGSEGGDSGGAQLYLIRTDGGEAYQLSDHETSVSSYAWGADGSEIFFVADEALDEETEKARKDGDDAIFVDEGPNGQQMGEWRNLWVIGVGSREERRLTEGPQRVGAFSVSPGSDRIVYTARGENRRNQSNLSEIHLLDVRSGETERLTENEAPEGRLLWSPDGRRFVYEAPSDADWELRLDKLWVMDPESGDRRIISAAFAGNIRNFVWTPDGASILFSGLRGTDNNLFKLDVDSGQLTQITSAVGSLAPASFSRDRAEMAYIRQDFTTPPDVWAGPTDGSGGARLTEANPWITQDVALGEGRVIQWTSRDGTEIEGVLMLPEGHTGGEIPLLLHIHGGPAGVFTNSFAARNHVWAGLGYAQLFPNVRGSSGYTDDLLRGNMYDIGGGDYWDLMTGVDHVIELGIADPTQLGVRGWSYGGILGGWTVTQTDRFKGASVGAMVADWTSEYGPGFNHDVRLWYIGGTPWDNPEEWRQRSALTHVADVTTPTLILHGMNDRTDTEPQSMMFFQALKDQGKTARYIRFPREPHGFREPRHQRTRDVEEIRWIQQHVRGIEWQPWERPSADAKKVVS